jgi:hypothetical protein
MQLLPPDSLAALRLVSIAAAVSLRSQQLSDSAPFVDSKVSPVFASREACEAAKDRFRQRTCEGDGTFWRQSSSLSEINTSLLLTVARKGTNCQA